jgi:hypothetical protein
MRVLSSTGAPLTNDVLVNQFTADAQVDTAVAVASNGNILAVFVDFSSHSGVGTGLNLYARLFNSSGVALTNEFQVPTFANNGDQRLPWVSVDGQNRFVVVWQSEFVDGAGAGYGIVARRFDVNANPIGTEFLVNTINTSEQIEPRVACDASGDFSFTWEDYSSGHARPMIRRYNGNGLPKGPESPIADTNGSAYRPEIVVSPAGNDIVIAYEEFNGFDLDVYARRFSETATPQIYCTGKLNAAGCVPQIAYSGQPSASSPFPFTISASAVTNQKAGMLFYGFESAFTSFQGGTLCLVAPRRTPIQFSNGDLTGLNCTGSFTYDFNARIQSGVDPDLFAGRTISAQYYYRDPLSSFATGLSNAVRFTICP